MGTPSINEIPRPAPGPIGLRPRLRLTRRRISYRQVSVLVLALAVAITVSATIRQARRQTTLLGRTEPVLVAATPIGPGAPLTKVNTDLEWWPLGLIPNESLASLPNGAAARGDIGVGEPITNTRVTDSGGLGPTEQAIQIPLYLPPDGFSIGDRVSVFAVLPDGGDQVVGVTATMLGTGRIIGLTGESAMVSMSGNVVPRILESLAVGAVDLVKQPG